jgi:cytochrome P450
MPYGDEQPDATTGATTAAAAASRVESRTDGMFVFMDRPEHTRLRRLLTGQFTVRRMRMLESHIREIAGRCIDAMLAAGTEADLVPSYALPVPSLVICELLGVDFADRELFQEHTALTLNSHTPDDEAAPPRSCTLSSGDW